MRITSWYTKFNSSHLGLPPSSVDKLTGLGGNFMWATTSPILFLFFTYRSSGHLATSSAPRTTPPRPWLPVVFPSTPGREKPMKSTCGALSKRSSFLMASRSTWSSTTVVTWPTWSMTSTPSTCPVSFYNINICKIGYLVFLRNNRAVMELHRAFNPRFSHFVDELKLWSNCHSSPSRRPGNNAVMTCFNNNKIIIIIIICTSDIWASQWFRLQQSDNPSEHSCQFNTCHILFSRKFSSAKTFVKSHRQAVRQEFIFVKRRPSLVCSLVIRSSLFCL